MQSIDDLWDFNNPQILIAVTSPDDKEIIRRLDVRDEYFKALMEAEKETVSEEDFDEVDK